MKLKILIELKLVKRIRDMVYIKKTNQVLLFLEDTASIVYFQLSKK